MYSLVLHLQITGQSLQFVQKIARLAETYHSKPAMFSTNQRQHCLARVLPPLGLIACFSALGSGWNKGYCFCSSFSYPH